MPSGGREPAALDPDHPVDVRRVSSATGLLDLGSDRVELATELVHLLGGEVGVFGDIGDGHGCSLRLLRDAVRSDVEHAGADGDGDAGLHLLVGLVEAPSPLRRSRTVPEILVTVQVWQMPTRQP